MLKGPRITQCRTLCSPRFLTTTAQPSRKGFIKRPQKRRKEKPGRQQRKIQGFSAMLSILESNLPDTCRDLYNTRNQKKFLSSAVAPKYRGTPSASSSSSFCLASTEHSLSKAREFTRAERTRFSKHRGPSLRLHRNILRRSLL